MKRKTFTIGEMSTRFGLTLRALRFYEEKGLLAPRRHGKNRLYSRADAERIGLIKGWADAGIALAEIKTALDLLDADRGPEVVELIAPRLDEIEQRLLDQLVVIHELRTEAA